MRTDLGIATVALCGLAGFGASAFINMMTLPPPAKPLPPVTISDGLDPAAVAANLGTPGSGYAGELPSTADVTFWGDGTVTVTVRGNQFESYATGITGTGKTLREALAAVMSKSKAIADTAAQSLSVSTPGRP